MELLTLELAEKLIDKKVRCVWEGYAGQNGDITFTLSKIVSEYDLAKQRSCNGFSNQAEYWESYMPDWKLNNLKKQMHLIASDDKETHIRSEVLKYRGRTPFWCGDSDRYVCFEEVSESN